MSPSPKILVEVLGDASSYERSLKRATDQSQLFERQQQTMRTGVEKTHNIVSGLAAGLIGAGGLVVGLEQVVEAAKAAQESQGHLAVTMKDAGVSYDENRQQIERLLSKQSELAGFQKTDLRESYARLISATQDVGKANEYLALTTDIARGRHISLEAATQLVIKAQMGMVGSLRRMGIEIQPVHDAMNALTDSHLKYTTAQKEEAKQLDLTATKQRAIAELQQRYAGQAEEYGKSSAGAADRFKVSLTNLEVTLGTALLPTLTNGLQHVTKWVNKLNDSGDAARYAHDGARILKGIIHDATPIVKDGAKAFQALADALGGDKQAVEALGGALAAWKLAGTFGAIGGKAGTSAGQVGALTRNLKLLGAIGVITVEIDIARKYEGGDPLGLGGIYSSMKTAVESRGAKGFNDAMLNLLVGPPGHRGAIGSALFGNGANAGGKSGSLTSSGNTPQTGSRAGKDQGAAIAAVAATQLGISYQWGGPAILGQHTDCSGLAQAVLAKNGINVGRTTYEQWQQGRAVMPGDLQPGDLVFFFMGKKGPDHVGIYIGNDQFIEDPHTGSSVRISKLSTYPGFVGARRYTTAASDTRTAGNQGGDTKGNVNDIVKHGKPKKAPIITGDKLLTQATRIALANAKGTKGTADDLTALDRAKAELEKLPMTVAVANELAKVNKQIHAIETADVKAHLKAQTDAYKKHAAEATAELKKLDAGWKTHVKGLDDAAAELKRVADRSFTEAEDQLFKQFDRLTQMGLSSLDSERQQLTPAEQKLKALQDAHASSAITDAIAKASADLATAKLGVDDGNGNLVVDPAAVKQAQAALDSALYDQQIADLQTQADAERAARDKEYADKAQAYQDQRDLDRQKLQDWLDDQKIALDAGRETWDTFYADLKKKAADGGWDIGTAFWQAWQDAAAANTDATRASNIATAAANGNAPGDMYQTIQQGLLDGTISRGLADLLRSGHKLEVPFLADGGIAVRPTLAVIGDGGAEAVIPLSRLAGTAGNGPRGAVPTLSLQVISDRDLAARLAPYIDDTGSAVVRVKVN